MSEAEKEVLFSQLISCIQWKVMGHVSAKMELAGIHKVHADTGIGIRTLKRMFGMEKAPSGYYPYLGTRDILCQYAGFVDWADFVRESTRENVQNSQAAPIVVAPSAAIDELPADIHYPNEPFRNLEWFRREDARIFFGRSRAIQEVLGYLATPHADQVIMIYGQSGVGKSSFLHAGLLPRLEAAYTVLYLRCAKESRMGLLLQAVRDMTVQATRPCVAILDQVEAMFVGLVDDGSEEWVDFATHLQALLQQFPQLKVLISFRKEYFADMDASLSKAGIAYKRYFLQPLDSQEIEEAVTGITLDVGAMEKYQLQIDPLVPEKILDLLAGDKQSHIAPTLQIILSKLWIAATAEGNWPPHFSDPLLAAHIKAKSHVLGDFIDEKVAELDARFPQWKGSGLVLDVLSFFVSEITTATERSFAQIVDEYQHLPDILALVAALRDCRLLSDPAVAGKGMLRLAHDALAPLVLHRVNNSSAPGQKARRMLESRKLTVEVLGRGDQNFHWDAQALRVIAEGQSGMRRYTPAEAQLLAASKAQLQYKARARRRGRRLQWAIALILFFFVVGAIWLISQVRAGANLERSLNLLNEARSILADRQADLRRAADNYQEILNHGFHKDSVAEDLVAFVAHAALARRPQELRCFFPVMARFPNDDDLKRRFFVEVAYFFALGKRYLDAIAALAYLDAHPASLYISAAASDSCRYIRLAIANAGETRLLAELDRRYLPMPILVARPEAAQQAKQCDTSIQNNFYLAATEVTNFQFLAWANASAAAQDWGANYADRMPNPAEFTYDRGNWHLLPTGNPNHPAIVDWYTADSYCNWFGWRLPRATEWAYAARGGAGQPRAVYSGGNRLDELACYNMAMGKSAGLCAVRSKKPNALGLYDMTGSLAEWLLDSVHFPTEGVIKYKYVGGSYRHGAEASPLKLETAPKENNPLTLLDMGIRPLCDADPCF